MIEVEQLERCYGDYVAVDDVSLEVGAREVVGLLGHNGAGKTTIMKMMTGFLEPTAGRITIDGLSIGTDTIAIQERLGYLPENCPLYPEMTVLGYLEYQASLHGVPAVERDAAIGRAITRTALQDKALAPIATLSRGYRQRVGVAQAILHRPAIVILDEPTNGLDPTQIQAMRSLIRELAEESTVIVSTHILQEVQAVCDRVLILRAGQLVVDARLSELQQQGQLVVTVDADSVSADDLSTLLKGIPGVKEVAARSAVPGRLCFAIVADEAVAPAVTRAVIEADIALFSLHTERRDLETLFAEVNSADAVASSLAGEAAQ